MLGMLIMIRKMFSIPNITNCGHSNVKLLGFVAFDLNLIIHNMRWWVYLLIGKHAINYCKRELVFQFNYSNTL